MPAQQHHVGPRALPVAARGQLAHDLAHLRATVLHRIGSAEWSRTFDLRGGSSLVDLGSGYGKVVLHLALANRVRRAVGIECVISRHEIAEQSLQEIRVEMLLNPSLAASSSASAGEPAKAPPAAAAAPAAADPFAAVAFHFGDGTLGDRLDFSHVYAFDRVFSRVTILAFAAILMRSPFRVFASYRPVGHAQPNLAPPCPIAPLH